MKLYHIILLRLFELYFTIINIICCILKKKLEKNKILFLHNLNNTIFKIL